MRALGSLAFNAWVVMSTLIVGVLGCPLLLFGQSAAHAAIKLWSQSVLLALNVFCGVRYRVEGAENIPEAGGIVAVNHQSMWETLVLFVLLPRPVMILKKELTRIPIYGWWALAARHIAVDRKGGAKALRDMRKKAVLSVEEGRQIVIFPEGTRLKPGVSVDYHPGVAGIYQSVNAICTPVAHDSGCFWRHPGSKKNPGVITIRFLPAIQPGLDRKTFLHDLKSAIDGARPDLANGDRADG